MPAFLFLMLSVDIVCDAFINYLFMHMCIIIIIIFVGVLLLFNIIIIIIGIIKLNADHYVFCDAVVS